MKTESEANYSQSNQTGSDGPSTPIKDSKSTEKKKKSLFNRALQKVGYALLFFFIGALVVGLVLYLPTKSDLNTAQSELDRLLPMEAEFVETSTKAGVYKILSDVSNMQMALIEKDENRAGQYANYIIDDLAELSIEGKTEIIDSLSSQFSTLSKTTNLNSTAVLEGLQDFRNDLLSLIDNL